MTHRIPTIPILASLFSSLGCPILPPDLPEADVVGESDDGIPGNDSTSGPATTTNGDGSGDGDGDDGGDDGFPSLCDFTGDEPGDPCLGGACNQIDILFVVDNSATMSIPQQLLSASLPLLFEKLQALTDDDGNPLNPDVNIMFTTTDVGHPLCTSDAPEGYVPAQGAPQNQPCTERIDEFTDSPETCTSGCPVPFAPIDPFIHFEGPGGTTTNVPGNAIAEAMRCLAPQGIVGCGYESPLEAMLQAINPAATWNQGVRPFVRSDAARLAVVFITNEDDCSVRSPDGYAYFTDPEQNTYWEVDPATGAKTHATSAVCWNSGVDCGAPDADGIYADCHTIDTGVLHPIPRYLSYLRDELIGDQNKEVVMLGILGVPTVTKRNFDLPFQPIDGGIDDLVYRQWVDGPYPMGDIIEPGESAASKEFEYGIGPGCTAEDGMGQAVPPARLAEVCEGLDDETKIRCIIESVCDASYDGALAGLAGLIQSVVITTD